MRMSARVTVEADKEATIEAAQNETSAERRMPPPSTVSAPAQAAEEGTDDCSRNVFEEAREASHKRSCRTQPEASEAVPVNGSSHQEQTPADAVAKEDILIAIPTAVDW